MDLIALRGFRHRENAARIGSDNQVRRQSHFLAYLCCESRRRHDQGGTRPPFLSVSAQLLGEEFFKPVNVIVTGLHRRIIEQLEEQRQGCINPVDDQFAQSPAQS